MNLSHKILTRAALLLALTLVLQSLRLLLPLPALASTILIGILVNACLMLAVEKVGVYTAAIIGVAAPVSAYLQQMLPLPLFILPVALGNLCYVLLLNACRRWPMFLRLTAAAGVKSVFLYNAFFYLLQQIALPAQLSTALLLVMGWPQLITGFCGASFGLYLGRRLREI